MYRILVGKPEGKRPLGRPRRRWVDNIRLDLQEVGCGYMNWIGLVQGVSEHGVEENIWTEEGRGNGGMEEIA